MAVSNTGTQQFDVIKNKDWFQTADSGDVTTYSTNTLEPHVAAS